MDATVRVKSKLYNEDETDASFPADSLLEVQKEFSVSLERISGQRLLEHIHTLDFGCNDSDVYRSFLHELVKEVVTDVDML